MKKLISTILIFVCMAVLSIAQETEHYQELFEKANQNYAEANYELALENYESLISSGIVDVDVYYNIANCYYKLKSYPTAILYYEKALKIDPTNSDALFNLDIASQHITDKIEALPPIFYINWWKNIVNLFSISTWSKITIYLAFLIAISIGMFVYTKSETLKKLSFYFILIFSFNIFIAYASSVSAKNRINSQNHAIIFSPSLNVKSAPAKNSTNLFVIHEGTKVELLQTNGKWVEIALADGNIGWIEKETLINI